MKYFVVLFFCFHSIQAQQTVFKNRCSIDSSNNWTIGSIVEYDSFYILSEEVYRTPFTFYTNSFRTIRKDNGNKIKEVVRYGDSAKNFIPYDIIKWNDTAFLALGSRRAVYGLTGSTGRGYAQLLDTALNIVKDTVYDNYKKLKAELFVTPFYHQNQIYAIQMSYMPSLDLDSTFFTIVKVEPNLSLIPVLEVKGYLFDNLMPTSDSGFLVYAYSKKEDTGYNTDPFLIKLDKNWQTQWELNIGILGFNERISYNQVKTIERFGYYYASVDLDRSTEYYNSLLKISKQGNIVQRWNGFDSTYFHRLYPLRNDLLNFGFRFGKVGIYRFDSLYQVKNNHAIYYGEFFDTTWNSKDMPINISDVNKVSDGGYLITNYGWSYSAEGKVWPSGQAFSIFYKTDSCGYCTNDTCKLIIKIDSIRYRTAYLSLDRIQGKYCGLRWHIGDSVLTTENFVYNFPDTGLYTISVWGHAGATVDSTSINIHIAQLDSCASRASDTCMVVGKQQRLACHQFLLDIDTQKSQYCTQYWAVEGKKYTSRTLAYTFADTGVHTVYAVAQRGIQQCIDTIQLIDTCKSSLSTLDIKEELALYPNPVEDGFWLKTYALYPNTKVTIYNTLGTRIASYPVATLSSSPVFYDIHRLANGIYYVEAHTSDKVFRRKVVKK